jgi:hypothetical protein
VPIESVNYKPLGKKHDWTENHYRSLNYEIKIRENGEVVDKFTWDTKNGFIKVLELIRLKYGMDYK